MKRITLFSGAALLCAAPLAGCNQNAALSELREITPKAAASPYHLALSRHFYHYAERLEHRDDGDGSKIMAERGLQALQNPQLPLAPEAENISAEQQQARAFVAYATRDPGLRERLPDETAQLRWLYDCWEYESKALFGGHMAANCRDAYYSLADTVFSSFAAKHIQQGLEQASGGNRPVKLHTLLNGMPESAQRTPSEPATPADDAGNTVIAPAEKTASGAAITAPEPPAEAAPPAVTPPPAYETPAEENKKDETPALAESAPPQQPAETAPQTPPAAVPAITEPSVLAARAQQSNPYLSVAERDAILGAPGVRPSLPQYEPKPAQQQAPQDTAEQAVAENTTETPDNNKQAGAKPARETAPETESADYAEAETPQTAPKPDEPDETETVALITPAAPAQPATAISAEEALKKRLHVIRFGESDNTPDGAARSLLETIAEAIKNSDDEYRVTVNGYSDSEGSDEANMRLSLQRALEVKRILGDAGVPKSAVDAFAYGDKWAPESAREGDPSSYRTAEILIEKSL